MIPQQIVQYKSFCKADTTTSEITWPTLPQNKRLCMSSSFCVGSNSWNLHSSRPLKAWNHSQNHKNNQYLCMPCFPFRAAVGVSVLSIECLLHGEERTTMKLLVFHFWSFGHSVNRCRAKLSESKGSFLILDSVGQGPAAYDLNVCMASLFGTFIIQCISTKPTAGMPQQVDLQVNSSQVTNYRRNDMMNNLKGFLPRQGCHGFTNCVPDNCFLGGFPARHEAFSTAQTSRLLGPGTKRFHRASLIQILSSCRKKTLNVYECVSIANYLMPHDDASETIQNPIPWIIWWKAN